MSTRQFAAFFVLFQFITGYLAGNTPEISHGPMLGSVSSHSARLWVRTTKPSDVIVTIYDIENPSDKTITEVRTNSESDHICKVYFDELKKETKYNYVVRVGESEFKSNFTTLDDSLSSRKVRLVYGSCYSHADNRIKPDHSVFSEMASRNADLVIFLGDFPYTKKGAKNELRSGHKKLREVPGFKQLTSSTPTYGIYDDHDFGPNDCDGTHKYANEALETFIEYWPNPSYGLPEDKGIYCSFVVGDVEFFLLDGRYPARQKQKTMLGKVQFEWLCSKLKASKSRYKVLASGVQFGRDKRDGWAGSNFIDERNKLFTYIAENDITGVIGISGDVHRSDIYKLPIGKGRYFYDFTAGALSRNQRQPPKPLPDAMIHSYGEKGDNNMYGEIVFYPKTDKEVAITFKSISAKKGVIYEHKLSPKDLYIEELETIPNK
jgi:alkaline phosphatase D